MSFRSYYVLYVLMNVCMDSHFFMICKYFLQLQLSSLLNFNDKRLPYTRTTPQFPWSEGSEIRVIMVFPSTQGLMKGWEKYNPQSQPCLTLLFLFLASTASRISFLLCFEQSSGWFCSFWSCCLLWPGLLRSVSVPPLLIPMFPRTVFHLLPWPILVTFM